jgi:hypothetical protein
METFILNHWPFLIAPAYILAGVVNCWITHLFFKNNPKTYNKMFQDSSRSRWYAPPPIEYEGLTIPAKFFGFTIGLVITPLFLISVYTGRMINKLLP